MTVQQEIRMILFAGALALALIVGIKAVQGEAQIAPYEATITVTAHIDG